MPKVAIVYHSGYGHTEVIAKAVRAGAASVEDTHVDLIKVDDVDDRMDVLNAADAIIFGCPTYMGSASAPFTAFMDKTSMTVFGPGLLWKDKIAAAFTNSAAHSGDKLLTLQQLFIFAAQQGMHWVNLGLPPGNNSTKGSPEDLNRLGSFIGAMAQSDADVGPDIAPPDTDKRTAEHLGRRVAEVTAQFVRGRR